MTTALEQLESDAAWYGIHCGECGVTASKHETPCLNSNCGLTKYRAKKDALTESTNAGK